MATKKRQVPECYNIGIQRIGKKLKFRFIHRLVYRDRDMDEWVDGSERKARKLLQELLAAS